MLVKTLFAGAGGQGVLSMGYCLAYAGMEEGRFVTYMPAYGAEVRGGTANCTIVISDEEIASPIASSPDNLIILNNPSLLRFQNAGCAKGTYLINSSLVNGKLARKDVKKVYMPASGIAEKMGNMRNTNMLLLGAFIGMTDIVGMDTMKDCIAAIFAKKNAKVITINQEALQVGYDYVAKSAKKKPAAKKAATKKKTTRKKAAKK